MFSKTNIYVAVTATLEEQINVPESVICVLASQIANLGESMIGAAFQEKEGFLWVCHYLTHMCVFQSF